MMDLDGFLHEFHDDLSDILLEAGLVNDEGSRVLLLGILATPRTPQEVLAVIRKVTKKMVRGVGEMFFRARKAMIEAETGKKVVVEDGGKIDWEGRVETAKAECQQVELATKEIIEVYKGYEEKVEEMRKIYNELQKTYNELKENVSDLQKRKMELGEELECQEVAKRVNTEILERQLSHRIPTA